MSAAVAMPAIETWNALMETEACEASVTVSVMPWAVAGCAGNCATQWPSALTVA